MFGLFVIEAGQEPVALLNREGKPVVVETGSEAAMIARECATGDYHGNRWEAVKVQPRRLANDAWKARELGRFADGTYTALPWADLPKHSITADHFAHISTEDGAKIAYTQDAAKGAGDIQTRVKPGKYLAQFYSDTFDAATIARMAAEFSNQYGESNVLLFATTADEFEHVYTNGPSSCMSHDANHFASPCHPVRVYAGFDLKLAYMERNGEITARALVWPEKKIHSRIYGDETRLSDLFEQHGYTSGYLDGAKITRRMYKDMYVIPYLDGLNGAADADTHLVLGNGRDVPGDCQNGLSGALYTCESCGDGVDEDNCQSDDDGNSYCEHCYNERFGYCEHTEETCDRDGMQEVIVPGRNGRTRTQCWSSSAIENDAFTCEGNDKLYSNDLLVTLEDGTQWSQEYFEDHGGVCEGDGEAYATDDMLQLEDGTMWSKDYFADNGVTVDGKHYAKGEPETDEDDDSEEETAAVIAKPYRASPTVVCDAQIEMPLILAPHIEGPDDDGDYCVMRGKQRVSLYCSTMAAANMYLAELVAIDAKVRELEAA